MLIGNGHRILFTSKMHVSSGGNIGFTSFVNTLYFLFFTTDASLKRRSSWSSSLIGCRQPGDRVKKKVMEDTELVLLGC